MQYKLTNNAKCNTVVYQALAAAKLQQQSAPRALIGVHCGMALCLKGLQLRQGQRTMNSGCYDMHHLCSRSAATHTGGFPQQVNCLEICGDYLLTSAAMYTEIQHTYFDAHITVIHCLDELSKQLHDLRYLRSVATRTAVYLQEVRMWHLPTGALVLSVTVRAWDSNGHANGQANGHANVFPDLNAAQPPWGTVTALQLHLPYSSSSSSSSSSITTITTAGDTIAAAAVLLAGASCGTLCAYSVLPRAEPLWCVQAAVGRISAVACHSTVSACFVASDDGFTRQQRMLKHVLAMVTQHSVASFDKKWLLFSSSALVVSLLYAELALLAFDVSTGALLCVYTGHSRAVTCLQIFTESDSPQLNLQKLSSTDSSHYSSSSSGSSSTSRRALLATGSCDGSVRVFDVDTGDCLDTLRSELISQSVLCNTNVNDDACSAVDHIYGSKAAAALALACCMPGLECAL
eukprot:17802-Heterococcus_DN1.PRE.2